MQELTGKFENLEPGMSRALKIVSYFDVLFTRNVGVDGLLRGAAVLAGATAGARIRGQIQRRDPRGTSPEHSQEIVRQCSVQGENWEAWLEGIAEPSAEDVLIVERLGLGLELLEARRAPASGLEEILNENAPLTIRHQALAKFKIDRAKQIQVVATPVSVEFPGKPSCVIPTEHGMIRATLVPAGEPISASRAGIGLPLPAIDAPRSWESALVALRLSGRKDPVVDASGLGALLTLAQAHSAGEPHPDIAALEQLDDLSAQILRILVEAESLRSAATQLGMHHSTLQARHESLKIRLGYDPRTNIGKLRYATAEFLHRLKTPENFH